MPIQVRHPFFKKLILPENSKDLFSTKQLKFSIKCQPFKNKNFSVYRKFYKQLFNSLIFKAATFSCIECSDYGS